MKTDNASALKPVGAITLDVEDWWHLDYFAGRFAQERSILLDGVETFLAIMAETRVQATLFVLGEVAGRIALQLRQALKDGHSIACHGWGHTRPLQMSLPSFREELRNAKAEIEDAAGARVTGYRAPCFSLDRVRLEIVRELGFEFDSSKIAFASHPLYGNLNLSGFSPYAPGLWLNGNFVEFEATTILVGGHHIPVSGGGYLRMFPWYVTRSLLLGHIKQRKFYLVYIHPFELSRFKLPISRREAGTLAWIRYSMGRPSTAAKMKSLINYLKSKDYIFATLPTLRNKVLNTESPR